MNSSLKFTRSSATLVGITGQIGAGKSTIIADLNKLGIASLNCDAIAKDLLFDEEVQARLAPLVGEKTFIGGVPNTSRIAKLLFENSSLREAVEAIVHPLVWNKVAEVASLVQGILLVESALFLTIPIPVEMKLLVEVACDKETRVARLVASRGMSAEDARARVEVQDTFVHVRSADIQVSTTSEEERTETINKLYRTICERHTNGE